MKTNIIVDLDDTLYLERNYVLSGFRAVAQLTPRPRLFAETCWALFESGRRNDIFDAALLKLGTPADPQTIDKLVKAYRHHEPSIKLADDSKRFLAQTNPTGLISDGPVESQTRKLGSLGLSGRFAKIILTDALGRNCWKPSIFAFQEIEKALGPGAFIYLGDNPRKDFRPARQLGWRTIRIRRPEGLYTDLEPQPHYEPDFEAETFDSIERSWLFSNE